MELTKEQIEAKEAMVKDMEVGVAKAELDKDMLELQRDQAKIRTEKNLYVMEFEVAVKQVSDHINLTKRNIEALKIQIKDKQEE